MCNARMSLVALADPSDLAQLMWATEADCKPGAIANNTEQVRTFVNCIALGDLVGVPLRASRYVCIGRIIGPQNAA
jgi:predicted Mrr-cat superfamily restriction endonuclease